MKLEYTLITDEISKLFGSFAPFKAFEGLIIKFVYNCMSAGLTYLQAP